MQIMQTNASRKDMYMYPEKDQSQSLAYTWLYVNI